MTKNKERQRSRCNGFTLIEALVALVIVAGGLLALLRFQSTLFTQAAISKQTSEATSLAQARMEELRIYATQAGYNSLAGMSTTTETLNGESSSYTRVTTFASHSTPSIYTDVTVSVSWTTSTGESKSISLVSAIAWNDPASGGEFLTGTILSCPAQTVTDGLCTGTSVSAENGASQTIVYSGSSGTGSGVWLCTNGVLSKTSGTCKAKCASSTVADATCQGTAAAAVEGDTVTVSYTSGGTGSGTFLCGSNGTFTKQSGSCDPSCSLPWGGILANGSSATAYKSSNPSVSCSSSTNATTLSCSNGTLSGDSTNFTQSSCSEPCFGTPWGTMVNGSSQTGYFVQNSTNCTGQAEIRTCNNGSLSGSAAYTSCTPKGTASCTTPWNTTVEDQGSVTAYQNQSSDPSTCATKETRICNNGTLSGSYQYQTNNCPCTVSIVSTVATNNYYFSAFAYNPTPTSGSWITSPSCSPTPNGTSTNSITCTGKLSLNGSVATVPTATIKKNSTTNSPTTSCSPTSVTCNASGTQKDVACTYSKS